MDEYTFVIQPVISLNPSPSHYEYNIKACYEIGQRHTYKRVTLDDFVEDAKKQHRPGRKIPVYDKMGRIL